MWPDRVSNPGPLTYESDALPTALCGPATGLRRLTMLLPAVNDAKQMSLTTKGQNKP